MSAREDNENRAEPVRVDPTKAASAIEQCWEQTRPAIPTLAQWQRCYSQLDSQPGDPRCVRVCAREHSVFSRYPVVLAGAYALSPQAAVRCKPGDLLLEMAAVHAPRQLGQSVVEPAWRVFDPELGCDERFTVAELAIAGVAQHGNGAFEHHCQEALRSALPTWRSALQVEWAALEPRVLGKMPPGSHVQADGWGRAYEAVLNELPQISLRQAFEYIQATLVQGVRPREVGVRLVLEAGVRLDTPQPGGADNKPLVETLSEMTQGTVGETARYWSYVLLAQSVRPDTSSAPSAHPVPRL